MSDAGSPAEYVRWQHPSAGYALEYALPVLQQIERTAAEGFHRIPHGGIETGGVLLGSLAGSVVRITGVQQIECEHAFGPSFHLSERDVERLQDQISANAADDGASDSIPVGWFIAHTRSELVLSDRELELFNRFFSGPGCATLLVKPEKFKPARFACLIRDRRGEVGRDGRSIAFLLPGGEAKRTNLDSTNIQPARADRVSPKPPSSTERAAPEAKRRERIGFEPAEFEPMAFEPTTFEPTTFDPPASDVQMPQSELTERTPEPTATGLTGSEGKASEEISFEREGTDPTARPSERPPVSRWAEREETGRSTTDITDRDSIGPEAAGPDIGPPKRTTPEVASSRRQPFPAAPEPEPIRRTPELPALPRLSRLRSDDTEQEIVPSVRPNLVTWSIFGASVVFGILAIYGFYLQFAEPAIPVTVTANANGAWVASWPADETRGVENAEVRVDDREPVQLSEADKEAGTYSFRAGSGDVMVDLIVHHRFRTARGITRYLVAPGAATAPTPSRFPPPR